ncbi:MAG: glycosyltransferase family 2 protein [Gemmatimonadaceae bacterium]|nr:glycosyltransferase family 2 protein [Gemmatimonadaceae bacterium]
MHKLSVLIPVYNERATIEVLIQRVLDARIPVAKEVLIGDDGSNDGTRDILAAMPRRPELRIEFMSRNVGRGGVLKHLLTLATGDIIIHQDADLEYDPSEYDRLLAPILTGTADVVYGSRFKGAITGMATANNFGNRLMSAMARTLYGVDITDLMTCYKMYRRSLLDGVTLHADGFHFEAEFTARLARRGARFAEVPISFVGRTAEEGKKIKATDAIYVIQKLVSCRFGAA